MQAATSWSEAQLLTAAGDRVRLGGSVSRTRAIAHESPRSWNFATVGWPPPEPLLEEPISTIRLRGPSWTGLGRSPWSDPA